MVKKQEEGGATEEETMEQCVARHMAADENLTEEQAHAICEEERKPPAPAEEKAFMDKLMAVFDEAIDLKMQKFWTEVNKRINDAIEKVQDQAVEALRKGMGVSKDPVIHLSELPGLVRKMQLEQQPHGKKTETVTKDKPTEGEPTEKTIPKAEDRFKDLIKDKGVL